MRRWVGECILVSLKPATHKFLKLYFLHLGSSCHKTLRKHILFRIHTMSDYTWRWMWIKQWTRPCAGANGNENPSPSANFWSQKPTWCQKCEMGFSPTAPLRKAGVKRIMHLNHFLKIIIIIKMKTVTLLHKCTTPLRKDHTSQ